MNSPPRWSEPDEHYGGFDGVEDTIRAAIRPDPILTVSEWADRHRILSTRLAAEAGPYRTSRTPFLKDVMDALSPTSTIRKVVFMKAAQVGAPLALDTPVPTPSGWTTIGEIEPGAKVFDERGRPVWVDGVSPVFTDRECFEVEFSDGEVIVADSDHLWTVDDGLSHISAGRTLTTKDMLGNGREGNRNIHYKVGERNRYAIPLTEPLDLPEAGLPIAPYTFGVWLGDGSSASNQVTTHQDDADEMAGYMTAEGHATIVRRPDWIKGNCCNLIIQPKVVRGNVCRRGHDMDATGRTQVHRRGRTDYRCSECNRQSALASKNGCSRDPIIEELGPWSVLKSLGVIANKHIPTIYLRASTEQRFSLLQGLMDTDGSVDRRGRCELTIADELLADGCVELIRSVGYKPTTSRRLTNEFVTGVAVKNRKLHTRISFMAYAERPVFRMRRKLEKMVTQDGKRTSETFRRRIVDIRPTASVPTRCIRVASDRHLFLAGRGMIATHNTEAGNNWLGYIIHWSPAPVMAVWPTVDTAKKVSQQRIGPLIEDSPALSNLISPAKQRESGNTTLSKSFPGGILVMTGANSGVGLRSMPARYAFLDELDAYPHDVDGEGDPIALVTNRSTTYGRKAKMFLVSTPTIHGESLIEREYEDSDQRRYFIPCPHCRGMQWLKFDRLKWDWGQPDTVTYICEQEGCEKPIEERFKAKFLDPEYGAEWRPTAVSKDPNCAGFHISALYSPLGWFSWTDMAREWEAAQESSAKLKTFKNTRLGETWFEHGEQVEWEKLHDRRETWPPGLLPRGVTLLIGAVDVQASPPRLELHVWGFGDGIESWAVERRIFPGHADDPKTWFGVEAALQEAWPHASGATLRMDLLAVDTGDQTTAVYAWIAKQDQARVLAVKGKRGFEINAPVATPSYMALGRRKKAITLRSVTGDVFKAELYRSLALNRPDDAEVAENGFPPGYVHIPDTLDSEWCKQLVAEKRVRDKAGRFFWDKQHPRNEALDCRVYARAALWTMGVAAWKPERWKLMRERRGLEGEALRAAFTEPRSPRQQAVAHRVAAIAPGAARSPRDQARRNLGALQPEAKPEVSGWAALLKRT